MARTFLDTVLFEPHTHPVRYILLSTSCLPVLSEQEMGETEEYTFSEEPSVQKGRLVYKYTNHLGLRGADRGKPW